MATSGRGRRTGGGVGTNQYGVKGVSVRSLRDAELAGKSNSAKKGLESISGVDKYTRSKKKFVSKMRVSAEGLKETGFTGFEAQAELLRDWSKKGFSERGRRKRRDHASRVLQENFPAVSKSDAEAIVSKPSHQMEGGAQFDHLGNRYGARSRSFTDHTPTSGISYEEISRGTPEVQNSLLNLVDKKFSAEEIEKIDLGPGVRIKADPNSNPGDN